MMSDPFFPRPEKMAGHIIQNIYANDIWMYFFVVVVLLFSTKMYKEKKGLPPGPSNFVERNILSRPLLTGSFRIQKT